MSLDAGKLRHRVVIEQRVEDQDSDTGDIEIVWAELATVWAAVEPMSARELLAADSVQSKLSTRIVIRNRAVDYTMRIIFRGQIYNIEGVSPDKESGLEYLTLMCSQGVNAG